METLQSGIVSVRDLLANSDLNIPSYQRPYKWTSKHVNQLIQDIAHHQQKSNYRLGTIVLHQERDTQTRNIVDGQQRTITLLLIVKALIACSPQRHFTRQDICQDLKLLNQQMPRFEFTSDISKANIHANYQEIYRTVSRADFHQDLIAFLLQKCQVVTVTLIDISEAFQFFDSQNSRGRDLEPHDLLKAYHLREFVPHDEPFKARIVTEWEQIPTGELADLFSQYLFRVRNWIKGASALYFGKDDVPLFKGVNLDSIGYFPYMESLRLAHHFVDNYNVDYGRRIDGLHMEFPFRLDQMIINGRRFFEMVAHYQKILENLKNLKNIQALDGYAAKILLMIDSYEGRKRTGDRYVRNIFDCLLLYYIDKFGHDDISFAIEKIFIWAFSLRLKMQRVYIESMDKYVLGFNLFIRLQSSICPHDFIHVDLPTVTQDNSTKAVYVSKLFEEMDYYGP